MMNLNMLPLRCEYNFIEFPKFYTSCIMGLFAEKEKMKILLETGVQLG